MSASQREPKHNPAGTRVLIVDDHPIVRQGLAQLINQQVDLAVCGEAGNVADALRVIEQSEVDVAVVDLSLRDSSGLDLIKDIQLRSPRMPVLVLSMRNEAIYADRALRAGALGYLTKEEGTAKVVEGIRAVCAGRIYLSEKLVGGVLKGIVSAGRRAEGGVNRLTDREMQVLEMIGAGLSTAEIARKLHLSVKTIETYRERMKHKLALADAGELLKYAIRWAHLR